MRSVEMPQRKVVRSGGCLKRQILSSSYTKVSIWMSDTDNMESMRRCLLKTPLLPVTKSILGGVDAAVGITAEILLTMRPGRNRHMTMTHLNEPKDFPSLKIGTESQFAKSIASNLAVECGVSDEAQLTRRKLQFPSGGSAELGCSKLKTTFTITASMA